jgi:hypothetical protein
VGGENVWERKMYVSLPNETDRQFIILSMRFSSTTTYPFHPAANLKSTAVQLTTDASER